MPAVAVAARPEPADAQARGEPAVLVPGRNCWRIDHAERLAFLIDGEAYFRAVRESIREARHSIFVLGWDVDSRMRLVPDGANDGWPEPFFELLNALLAERKRLRAHVLSWDFAMLYLLERQWTPLYAVEGLTHRRLSYRLDAHHPTGASHHQKIVVVDDSVAFVSGFDITRSRWDSTAHAANDRRRTNPFGLHYGPFHDVGAVVEGKVARSLGELARARWERATGKAPRCDVGAYAAGRWPASVAPDLEDVPVATARTEPAFGNDPGVDELRRFHLDAIAGARHAVFAENQYFTSGTIAEAFGRRLDEPEGPDVVVISPGMQSGWLEVSTMGVLRARINRRLTARDRHGHYRLLCPKLPWLPDDQCLNVHSKVLVIDDRLAMVGSANLSNRSMGFDTECGIAIEAGGDARIAAAIRGLRDRLLAEHLDCDPAAIAASVREHGRLIPAIQALQRPGGRTLASIETPLDPALDAIVPESTVFDPERPIAADRLVDEFVVEPEMRSGARRRVAILAALVLLMVVAALVWRHAGLSQWLDLDTIVRNAEGITVHPLRAAAAVIAIYVLGSFVLMPLTLLIGATVVLFGPVEGALLALAGALASAAATFAIGRTAGRHFVRRLAGRRLNELSARLARQGVIAVMLVRMLPLAPFSIVNVVAGATHIGWRDFLVGSTLGLMPGVTLTALFVDRAVAAAQSPGPGTVGMLAAVAAIAILVIRFLQRRLVDRQLRASAREAEHAG